MSIFEHNRWEVFNKGQHPYKHSLSEFAYANPAIPDVTNVQSALNWIFAVIYPQAKDPVDTVGDLPAIGNTINDYRVVKDDGDGKAASYRWEQREGEASASWHKIYDMDWGESTILSNFLLKTQDVYVYKYGIDDLDETGSVIAGTYAGQTIYGGQSASTNLTLKANSGDGVGAQTGFVQVDDNFRPAVDDSWAIGTGSERFTSLFLSTSALIDTMTIQSGSITDSSGAIDFGDENLSTDGTISSGTLLLAGGSITDGSGDIDFDDENLTTTGDITGAHLTADYVTATGQASEFFTGTTIGTLTLADGSITDSSGAIDFGNEDLSTTGILSAGDIDGTLLVIDGVLQLDSNSISILSVNTDLNLSANGTGVIDMQSAMTTLDQTVTGTVDITGQLDVDNITINGSSISSTGDLFILPSTNLLSVSATIRPGTSNARDLGSASLLWKGLYLGSVGISDGSLAITTPTLMSLRDVMYRDLAQTQPAQTGDTLFWDAVNSVWLASHPDSEIDHGELTGLGDDDHTQYALLAGRAGGQILIGGTGANNNLTLESTSNVTKGNIVIRDTLLPDADDDLDLGSASFRFQDLYMSGQGVGFRAENAANFASLPLASASNAGRLAYDVAEKDLYLDQGGVWAKISIEKYVSVDATNWDGAATSVVYDTSADITDARYGIYRMYDNANTYAELFPQITKGVGSITVSFDTPPPAGTYTIVGMA